jgi:hypothetical protein
MIEGMRVRVGKRLGILDHISEDGTCAVRLINENEWPFPEWVYVHQSQVKRAYQPKRNLDEYEEAPY